ncbi:DNA-binding transcriptional regulator Fis [Marinicellulosiphila megalodicopiae]|uniref:DNA-binding transcriptional regulator Fis n=1 Tax=Marinicellulosiphila megalodicopiae TaxID=2724896 RepID=UPI003BB00C6A
MSINVIEQPENQTPSVLPVELDQTQTLRDSVAKAMAHYFEQLEGEKVSNVYDFVLAEIEAPLLEATMKFVRDNQTNASKVLGLNRGTLRKKLKQYDLL